MTTVIDLINVLKDITNAGYGSYKIVISNDNNSDYPLNEIHEDPVILDYRGSSDNESTAFKLRLKLKALWKADKIRLEGPVHIRIGDERCCAPLYSIIVDKEEKVIKLCTYYKCFVDPDNEIFYLFQSKIYKPLNGERITKRF